MPVGPAPTTTTGTGAGCVIVPFTRIVTVLRCAPRSMAPSSVADRGLDDVAVLQVLRVVGLALEEGLPLHRGRQQASDDLDRLGRGAQRGAGRGAGQHQVAGGEVLEPGQRLQRRSGR